MTMVINGDSWICWRLFLWFSWWKIQYDWEIYQGNLFRESVVLFRWYFQSFGKPNNNPSNHAAVTAFFWHHPIPSVPRGIPECSNPRRWFVTLDFPQPFCSHPVITIRRSEHLGWNHRCPRCLQEYAVTDLPLVNQHVAQFARGNCYVSRYIICKCSMDSMAFKPATIATRELSDGSSQSVVPLPFCQVTRALLPDSWRNHILKTLAGQRGGNRVSSQHGAGE